MRASKKCDVCGKEFQHQNCPKSQRIRRRYCSQACAGIARRHSNYGRLLTCETCGSQFLPFRQDAGHRYCSMKCKGIAFRTSRYGRTRTCEQCGREFDDDSSPARHRRFCSQDCFRLFRRQQPGYRGGEKTSFKVRVANLFPSPCAICGWDEARTDAAHIVPRGDTGPDTVENGVILCPNHHRKFDGGLIPIDEIVAARDASLGLT